MAAIDSPDTPIAASEASPAERSALMANAIRALSMDAVQQANSGHPGAPMGMAEIAVALWGRHLRHNPADPRWPGRDRFVLSNGHGSMLQYALLHLTGYDLAIGELKNFRQLHSKTPGHPEVDVTPGVETTTGPLGQGLGNAVGMALAERMLAAEFGKDLVDHHTYVIAGDGCLMEGISHEAISLAGHLRLGRLIVLFDDNRISIDGPTSLSVSDDQLARFAACGWNVGSVDGHDPEAIAAAIEDARASDRPSLLACRTVIGYGAPTKAGTAATHGSPLGADEIKGAREQLGWTSLPFEIPAPIRNAWREAGARNRAQRDSWQARHAAHQSRGEFDRRIAGTVPGALAKAIVEAKRKASAEAPKIATRQSSQNVLEAIVPVMPELVGGSADLTGSNNTKTKSMKPVTADDFAGRYIYYGVREHGMAAAMNGIALHRGFAPYGGTFLVFTDYCRPSLRLSALMGLRVVYVMTHDSIGLGEDGPTHQPVEHLAALRAIPNLHVFRPADTIETAECWQLALESSGTPSIIALSRQAVPTLRTTHSDENLSARGGYVLLDASTARRATIIATGTEVEIAVAARAKLEADGIGTAVVSMPCWSLFDAQPDSYRDSVLAGPVRISIEAAGTFGWERYVGPKGGSVGMTGFGASAPAPDLYRHFGITADAVVDNIRKRL